MPPTFPRQDRVPRHFLTWNPPRWWSDQRPERSVTLITEWIEKAAARRGGEPYLEAPYFEDGAGTGILTYAALRRSTRVWADCLDRAGVLPGARVAVRLPDPLRYATALVGILGAGRVVIPLDPGAPAAELSRVLAAARPEAVVSDSASGLPPDLAVLSSPDPTDGQDRPNGPGVRPGAEHPAIPAGASRAGGIFLCTSGTTGAPKGVLLREDQIGHVAAGVAGHHRLSPADRGYCCLPDLPLPTPVRQTAAQPPSGSPARSSPRRSASR
jgi:acyl-CoA synthetase (AMP-forming)/AMP-acid ligase II